ncbi:MAG: nucleoside triphosphate pyrophosphatase [Sphingomicrobium sp.]
MTLILASTSPVRRELLTAAGLSFDCHAPGVDEVDFKTRTGDPAKLAELLARAKAEAVSAAYPDDWTIGSDSVVSVDGQLFDKPADRADAAAHLRAFSGRSMLLTSAVALARSGASDWSHVDQARLQVRDLSETFIADYLDAEWPDVSYCVGVFRMEGRGVQLFETIEGSHFAILGMSLLPLLDALRERGLLAQ